MLSDRHSNKNRTYTINTQSPTVPYRPTIFTLFSERSCLWEKANRKNYFLKIFLWSNWYSWWHDFLDIKVLFSFVFRISSLSLSPLSHSFSPLSLSLPPSLSHSCFLTARLTNPVFRCSTAHSRFGNGFSKREQRQKKTTCYIHIYQPLRSGRIWHKVNF